jgi:hypothetical protein
VIKVSHLWAGVIFFFMVFGCYQFYLKNTTHRTPENVVKAYYNALDFKEFEEAYSMLNPNFGKTKAQFMLEVSVSDGLLSSYAKLNNMEVRIVKATENYVELALHSQWVSPLKNIDKSYIHHLEKLDGKWYINPTQVDTDIPPDQLIAQNQTVYYNHGRRRISSEKTFHEDVLKQPVVEVVSAQLIAHNGSYAIVGQIQNIDNVPADIAINGSLYSSDNTLLATYNSKDVLKHKLLPKEQSSFRVNFEGIAWSMTHEKIPEIFNPDEYTPTKMDAPPARFSLQVKANVATSELFTGLALQNLFVEEEVLEGIIFNHSTQNATVPQLQITYYDDQKNIIWIENEYINESIGSQRKKTFQHTLIDKLNSTSINNSMEFIAVNGLPNHSIAEKMLPERNEFHQDQHLISVTNKTYAYISVKANCFIGAPF